MRHGYYASCLPPGALLLAESDSCPAELFVAGPLRSVLACQSHPEFDYGHCLEDRILKRLLEGGRIDEETARKVREDGKLFDRVDSDEFLDFVSAFLRS